MPKCPYLVLLLVALALPLPVSAQEPVFVRGTIDGAYVRLPNTKLADVTVELPDPRQIIITAQNAAYSSGSRWPRAEFIEHVQVFGPELMGGGVSRIVLRVTVSNMSWRLEEDRIDTLVILEGATPLRQEAVEARADRSSERAERRRAEREAEMAAEEEAEREEAEKEEAHRLAAEERRQAKAAKAAAPAPDPDAQALRAELSETQARLKALELQIAAGSPAPASPPAAQSSPGRKANETARQERQPASVLPADPPRAPLDSAAAEPPKPARIERTADGMVRVPAGPFTMGTPMGYGFADEVPTHVVSLAAFEIDEHEVTVGDFQLSPFPLPRQPDWNWGTDQPVVNVSWGEAMQYCEWQEKRLPTEAEWEKAARGSEGVSYPWGNQFSPTRANSGLDGDGHAKAAPVGSFALGASPYGALDMSGNVWEWTHDWYDENYYAESPTEDPQGPPRGTYRVVRGGSFDGQSAMNVRAAIRMPLKASARRENVGFRCGR